MSYNEHSNEIWFLHNCRFLFMYGIHFFCRNTAAASIAIRKMAVSVIDSSDLRYTGKMKTVTTSSRSWAINLITNNDAYAAYTHKRVFLFKIKAVLSKTKWHIDTMYIIYYLELDGTVKKPGDIPGYSRYHW